MKYFICYDISSDAWRDKTARLLEAAGCHRVQKSVFVAVDFSPKEFNLLRQKFDKKLAPHLLPGDSVLCLPVENDLALAVSWHGTNLGLLKAMERNPVILL